MTLSSIKAKYVALTFAAKEATWMRLLLIKLGLLDKKGHYVEIKVLKNSKEVEQIKANAERQEGEALSTLTNIIPFATSIPLKKDN